MQTSVQTTSPCTTSAAPARPPENTWPVSGQRSQRAALRYQYATASWHRDSTSCSPVRARDAIETNVNEAEIYDQTPDLGAEESG